MEFLAEDEVAEGECDDGFADGHRWQGLFEVAGVEGKLLHDGSDGRGEHEHVGLPVEHQAQWTVVEEDVHHSLGQYGDVAEDSASDDAQQQCFIFLGSALGDVVQ